MNKFYYLDCCRYDVYNYEIVTDMSYKELTNFLCKKARQYCEENDINATEYMCGDGEYIDTEFDVQINKVRYYFALHTFLEHGYRNRLRKKPFEYKKMTVMMEDTI